MGQLHQKVLNALAPLGKFEDRLHETTADRLTGVIVAASFVGQTHGERQRRLRALLADGLTNDELRRLGPIATLTPAETRVAV